MQKSSLYFILALVGLIIFTTSKVFAQNKMKKEPVLWTAEDIKWEPMEGAPIGTATSMLWGDQNKGAYGGLTKFPAGFKAPSHYHTNDMKIVVIKGAYIYNGKEYGPGSYVFIPGRTEHESGGLENSETIFFVEQPGIGDVHLTNQPKNK